MRLFTKFILAVNLTLCLSISHQLRAGELEDFIELKKTAIKELVNLKASGKGERHPEVLTKVQLITELENKISTCKESHEEIIILLKGTSSFYLKGHSKFGKTDTALPTLLLTGWKIKTMTPAGEDKAYVLLTRE